MNIEKLKEPEAIYLQRKCCTDDKREWCDHDVWECEDGNPATKYIRADLVADRPALLRIAEAAEVLLGELDMIEIGWSEVEELRAALKGLENEDGK